MPVFASTTDGTIDGTYKYAWSEKIGWINFGTSFGNVHITDSGLTGYIWNNNLSWISLNCSNTSSCAQSNFKVSNDGHGNLSGYAWGEGFGWINFSGVTIDSSGYFHGYANGTATGRISFNCANTNSCSQSDFKVKTDWLPSVIGGGGGGSIAPATAVTLSGLAYPKSTVIILKDAQIAATTVAGADATFQVSVNGLSSGNYTFSVYSKDNQGIRSCLLTFPITVVSGASSNISDIFIAPTIAVDKSQVKLGDNIAIFGQSVPNSEITIIVNSDKEISNKINTDKNGAYFYNLNTSAIDYGTHYAKSKAGINNLKFSSYSQAISFLVGTKNVVAEKITECPAKADLNNDCKVNLVDFSIAAYWYKRSSPPASIDINGDKKIDLIDFSIMAYYWTG